ncbi:MAG: hypothetical protein JJ916_04055 [Phycisphaerales bacterium]|nr:hypothetical protein [Phycisphaerales bacterium]
MKRIDLLPLLLYLILLWPIAVFQYRIRDYRTPFSVVMIWAVFAWVLNMTWIIGILIAFNAVRG